MRAIALFAVIALVTAMMTATHAAAVAHVTLTVRLYNNGQVPAAELLLARDTATPNKPARSTFQVAALVAAGAFVEIEVQAARGK